MYYKKYNGILFSLKVLKRKEMLTRTTIQINFEDIMPSKISQTKPDKKTKLHNSFI